MTWRLMHTVISLVLLSTPGAVARGPPADDAVDRRPHAPRAGAAAAPISQSPRRSLQLDAAAGCDAAFGGAYLEAWRAAGSVLCPASGGGGAGASGAISCFQNPAAPLTACVSRDLVASPSGFPGKQAGYTPCGEGTHLPAGARPALRRWLAPDLTAPLSPEQVAAACGGGGSGGAITAPVLLVHRDDTVNTFHALECARVAAHAAHAAFWGACGARAAHTSCACGSSVLFCSFHFSGSTAAVVKAQAVAAQAVAALVATRTHA